MRSVIAITTLVLCMASPALSQSYKPAGSGSYRATITPQPQFPAAPRPPAPVGATSFTPYKPTSTYSNRGGVNAYPSAPKPKGYLSPYGKR